MVRSTTVLTAILLTLAQCGDDAVGGQDGQSSGEEENSDDEGEEGDDDEGDDDEADEATPEDEGEDTDNESTSSGDDTAGDEAGDEAGDSAEVDTDGGDGADEAGDGNEGIETGGDGGDSDCLDQLELDEERLRQITEALSGEREVMIDGETQLIEERSTQTGRALTRAWLEQEFAELDLELETEAYATGENLVAQLGESDGEFFVLSSHYDAPSASPGANDAAAVAVLLGITAALRDCELPMGLRVLVFDEQELATRGSEAFVAGLDTDDDLELLRGTLNLDTLGFDSDGDGKFQVTDCGHPHTEELRAAVAASESEDQRLSSEGWCNGTGDHQSFWDAEKAAVSISQLQFGPMADANDLDGTEFDTAERIDFAYLAEVGALAGRSLLRLMHAD